MAADSFKVGDIVFLAIDGVTGEGMFVGRLKRQPDALVLIVGETPVEIDASVCSRTGRGFPAEGESYRRKYLTANPAALVPS